MNAGFAMDADAAMDDEPSVYDDAGREPEDRSDSDAEAYSAPMRPCITVTRGSIIRRRVVVERIG
jgi:hypothetical protein